MAACREVTLWKIDTVLLFNILLFVAGLVCCFFALLRRFLVGQLALRGRMSQLTRVSAFCWWSFW